MFTTLPNLHFLLSSLLTGRASLTFRCLGCLELTLQPRKSLKILELSTLLPQAPEQLVS